MIIASGERSHEKVALERSRYRVGMRWGPFGVGGQWGSRHPDLDFGDRSSTQTQIAEQIHGCQEDGHPDVIRQQAKHELSPTVEDLAGQSQPHLQKLLELHAQQGVSMLRFGLQ